MNDICAVSAALRAKEREYREAAAKRPKCSWCEEPIWDDRAYKIDGEWVCLHCIEECEEYVWDDVEY